MGWLSQSNDFTGDLISAAIVGVELLFAVWLFCRGLPKRDRLCLRVGICIAATAAIVIGGTFFAEPYRASGNSMLNVIQIFFYCLVPLMLAGATLFCRKTSVWVAIFCGIGAHTMQNIGSGIEGLLRYAFYTLKIQLPSPIESLLIAVIGTATVYSLCERLFLHELRRNGLQEIRDRGILLVLVVAELVSVVFDIIIKTVPEETSALYQNLLRIVHLAMAAFILYCLYEMLYNRQLQQEIQAVSHLLANSRQQYEASKETIDAINMKCHDLKHQIRALKGGGVSDTALEELAATVQIYDTTLRTGNEALDVILTEKALVCEREGITFTRIVDGKALDHIAAADLYSLFGNALDNAIEATLRIKDSGDDFRSISLTVKKPAGLAVIHLENYFTDTVDLDADFPVTQKLGPDGTRDTLNHGYGIRSMRAVVKRYGGTLSISADGDIFCLDIAIPSV